MSLKIYKGKIFSKWAKKEGVGDAALRKVVEDMEGGLGGVSYGSFLYKQRVGLENKGKSGGVRTILAFKKGDRAFFIYGFAKSKQSNISMSEEKALKLLSKTYVNMTDEDVKKALDKKEIIEIKEVKK